MLNIYEELGESSRRQILSELRTGPKNVSELVTATKLKQPNVSNHLARMRAKGIVKANKVGRQVYYTLADPEVEAVVHSVFANQEAGNTELDLEDLAKQYAKAAIQGDEFACGEILDSLFRARLALIDVYQEVLAPAMALVGTWYKVDAIDEAQEHMASAITERMMARTVHLSTPIRRNGKTALLGCAPNSFHVIGLRMIGDYLRVCGWKTLFLGANVPTQSYVTAVQQHRPALVLISCSAEEAADPTLDLIRQLAELKSRRGGYVIGAGGHLVTLYPDKFFNAGIDFTTRDLRSFADDVLPEVEASGRVPEHLRGFAAHP